MTPSKPVAAAKKAAGERLVADKPVPGTPGSEPPSLEEPTEPRDVRCRRSPTSSSPTPVSPTGAPSADPSTASAQQGAYLTTATGRAAARQRPLAQGRAAWPDPPRGPPPPREDHALRPRAHPGARRARPRCRRPRRLRRRTARPRAITRAAVLRARARRRRSSCASRPCSGSRGSADTVRDTRGFATKFYTTEGNLDLVGNNIPVFFIQDGIKFPDVIHAGKPHPDREIPQAQSAHDTFWDFVSLHTEAHHHAIWNMSDRGIPRSLPDDGGLRRPHLPAGRRGRRDRPSSSSTGSRGSACTPSPGRRPSSPAGVDPDFHRRDLYDAIEAGAFPAVGARHPDLPGHPGPDVRGHRPARPDQARAGGAGAGAGRSARSTLDAEPDELLRRDRAGRLPHRPPACPGIDGTDDPLLQARNSSPTSTPSSPGSAGPNFNQIPINRPHAPVNDKLPRRLPPAGGARRGRAVPAELARRRLPVPRGRGRGRVRRRPGHGAGGHQGPGEPGVVRRPLQPGAPVLARA